MDSMPLDRPKSAGISAGDEIQDILEAISGASERAINELKTALSGQTLHTAVQLLDQSGSICLVGQGDAFPVAALLANGLTEQGCVCSVYGPSSDAAKIELSLLGPNGLLIVIKLPGDAWPAALVADARSRNVPILAFTESPADPEASYCQVCLPVAKSRIFGAPSLAGHIAAAQLMLIALEHYRAGKN